MIRIATVFSGIGAAEQALQQLGVEHEIVFACDNGDIDIFSKKIDVDMDQINNELNTLDSIIESMNFSEDDSYELQLLNTFSSKSKLESGRVTLLKLVQLLNARV